MKCSLVGWTSLICVGFSACVHKPAAVAPSVAVCASSASYEERFDAWRASNRALDPAKNGDAEALIAFFLAGYVRLSEPVLGGEDLEQMIDNYSQLLAALGDDGFSKALQEMRPEVRSAAKWFIAAKKGKGPYPKTYRLLEAAPQIDWPVD